MNRTSKGPAADGVHVRLHQKATLPEPPKMQPGGFTAGAFDIVKKCIILQKRLNHVVYILSQGSATVECMCCVREDAHPTVCVQSSITEAPCRRQ